MTMHRQQRHPNREVEIGRYVGLVVALSAVIVFGVFLVTGNWVSGAVIGAIAGGLAAALYPLLARREK